MKVYIAAPFFNPDQLKIVVAVEMQLLKKRVEYFSPRSEGTLGDMTVEEQKKSRKKIFDSNVANMMSCDAMIACVEYKDTGTIWEMGFFYAMGKPIIMLASDPSKINVMLAESSYIAFSSDQAVEILFDSSRSQHEQIRGYE